MLESLRNYPLSPLFSRCKTKAGKKYFYFFDPNKYAGVVVVVVDISLFC